MEKYLFAGVLIVALLIVFVQIVTEAIKSVIKDKTKYNIVVLVVSFALTIPTVIAVIQISKITLTWYIVFAAIALSFAVAYGAMFGYDKLFKNIFTAVKQSIETINDINNGGINDEKDK